MRMIMLAVLATVAALFALIYAGQRRLLYFPDRTRTDPKAIGLMSVDAHEIVAPDGARIIIWYGRAKPGKPTLLYFHGNGGALAARAPRFERFMSEGWGVAMMAYRGYAGSTGSPTETHNIADALRAHDWLLAQGVAKDAVVLYGESLGTGVATQVAAVRPVAGLILDAPYTSTYEVGARRFPFLPVARMMWDRYETRAHIKRVACPVLILHGALDPVIPVDMGREVARLANEPKTYVEFPNGGHIDLFINGNDALTPMRAFMAAVQGR
jgi:uncharacterized protein